MTIAELIEEVQRRKAEASQIDASAPVAKTLDYVLQLVDRLDGVEMTSRFVHTREAAGMLGMAQKTISKWCRSGRFAGAEKTSDGGDWRIPVDTVYAALSRKPQQQPSRRPSLLQRT